MQPLSELITWFEDQYPHRKDLMRSKLENIAVRLKETRESRVGDEQTIVLKTRATLLTLLAGEVLESPFSPELSSINLYAREDSSMLLKSLERALDRGTQNGNDVVLYDFCTGTAVVPIQLAMDEKVHHLFLSDIDVQQTHEALHIFHENGDEKKAKIYISSYDLLTQEVGKLPSHQGQSSPVVSANPPWVPLPEELVLDHRSLIDGGVNGLKFLEPLLKVATHLKAERTCINLSSLSDVQEILRIFQQYHFGIEHIDVLETFSYGTDALKEVQEHIKSIPGNAWRIDENGRMRYMIFSFTLVPNSSFGHVKFEEVCRKYSSYESDQGFSFSSFFVENADLCTRRLLNNHDMMRMSVFSTPQDH